MGKAERSAGRTCQFSAMMALPKFFGLKARGFLRRVTLDTEERLFFFWSWRPIVTVGREWGGGWALRRAAMKNESRHVMMSIEDTECSVLRGLAFRSDISCPRI